MTFLIKFCGVGVGFEPTYAMRADLQSAAFNHSAEWLKAADCKSARIAYVGSNPTPTPQNLIRKVIKDV